MSCIRHECLAIALELRQSMDHSFAATCSLCNAMPPASKSGPDNFETLPERRADVSSANVDVKLHDSPMCSGGLPGHAVSPKRRGRLKFANRASCRGQGRLAAYVMRPQVKLFRHETASTRRGHERQTLAAWMRLKEAPQVIKASNGSNNPGANRVQF
jgi:hypothetical protein